MNSDIRFPWNPIIFTVSSKCHRLSYISRNKNNIEKHTLFYTNLCIIYFGRAWHIYSGGKLCFYLVFSWEPLSFATTAACAEHADSWYNWKWTHIGFGHNTLCLYLTDTHIVIHSPLNNCRNTKLRSISSAIHVSVNTITNYSILTFWGDKIMVHSK